MKWQNKAAAFRILDVVPFGSRLHYLLQKHVTRTIPRPLREYPRYTRESLAIIRLLGDKIDRGEDRYFEFGAGWDLFHNMLLYAYGVRRQFLMDLTPHMRPELVDCVIDNLQAHPPAGARRIPRRTLSANPLDDLRLNYGITYHAPSDARNAPLEEGSIDIASTVNTLEHIPFPDLAMIMRELKRLCASGAQIIMQVDYSDHYSHSDTSISPYNFLRFSESDWRRYNTRSHYQNRRRHPDYQELFKSAGFRIVSEQVQRPAEWEAILAQVPLHTDFAIYDRSALAITSAIFSMEVAR